MQKEDFNWFASWFDSPYYHILYKDRDYEEAGTFVKNLASFLNLDKNAKILDLACGKGRHSKHLASLGYNVTGVDLSPNSIKAAKKFETENLSFEIHDMCIPFDGKFDAILNLFTSFGYFETEIDNLRTIKAIKTSLKPEGFGVIDFLNVAYLEEHLVPSEEKIVEGIIFQIERRIENNHIIKDIRFKAEGQHFLYTEKVKALTLSDFKEYFKEAGVTLKKTFGNYQLDTFDPIISERLILIFGL